MYRIRSSTTYVRRQVHSITTPCAFLAARKKSKRKFQEVLFGRMVKAVPDSHVGCYIALPNSLDSENVSIRYPDWCFGAEPFESDEEGIPDISIDPEDGILSVINTSDIARTYYVTVENCSHVRSSDDVDLLAHCRSSRGLDYITYVVLVNPHYCVDLCQVVPQPIMTATGAIPGSLESVEVSSDIQDFILDIPSGPVYDLEQFPLEASGAAFLCTQSVGGSLTHFAHPSTYHAVDFRCPVGTPVLAVFDGTVVDIRNDASNSGVRVKDLFSWNSVMVKHVTDDLYCEYVHVTKDSFRVAVDDIVKQGDVLCLSGDSGFCPEPHLHFEVHTSPTSGNPSVPISWKGSPFQTGSFYP